QLTVVVPKPNVLPGAGTQLRGTEPATASEAVAENDTTFPDVESASVVMFAGRLREGATVSWTVTEKSVDEWLLFPSVAVHVTGVVPIGKALPDAGVQTTSTGSLTPLTSDGAGTLKVTFFDEVDVESGTSGNGPNAGGIVSWIVTLKLPAGVPSLSRVQVTS